MAILPIVAALAAASDPMTHATSVTHRGTNLDVTYSARLIVDTRAIGNPMPHSRSTARCTWNASLAIDRSVGGAPGREVARDPLARGSRAGDCREQRRAIDAEVARDGKRIAARLESVAAADRPVLLAELAALGTATGN